ncbi:uncharacterized protein TNCV_1179011 [Trichonephila clavipes]|nr:uncharacterized protein TNCV_1179011 [Trichonephila clavipes]
MIANYVNEQHDTWDQFLSEFAYAICTAVNEKSGKTPAELFLGRKLITPFQKLVIVSDGTEFAVRIYGHRKCDETEIGTGSSDNGSLRDESSGFDSVQRRSKESEDGKKKGLEVKRELEEKGLSFKHDQGEKHTNKTNKRGSLIRSIPSSWSEKSRRIKRSKKEMLGYKRSHESRSGGPERKMQKGSEHRVPKRALSSNDKTNSNLPKFRKKSRREETVTPTTSGYNLRPQSGKRAESRPTIERKTQQGGPVRSRKGRGRNDSTYIEDRTRSNNRNARRGGDQQRQDQERSVYEKVFIPGGLGRKRQLQVIRTRLCVYRFFLYSFEQVVGRIIAMKQVTVGYLKFKKPSKSGHYNECVFLEEKNKLLSCNNGKNAFVYICV